MGLKPSCESGAIISIWVRPGWSRGAKVTIASQGSLLGKAEEAGREIEAVSLADGNV